MNDKRIQQSTNHGIEFCQSANKASTDCILFVFIIVQRNVVLDTLIKRVKELRGSCSFVYTAAAFIIF